MSELIHPKSGPAGSIVGRVLAVAYHRNGISGEGFHRIEFDSAFTNGTPNLRLLAIVTQKFDKKENEILGEAYVVSPTDGGSAWRGTDHFGPPLYEVIKKSKYPHEIKSTKPAAA